MTQYRKKPVVIDAVQWDGNQCVGGKPEWLELGIPDQQPGTVMRINDTVHIGTLEGVMVASAGDWIIRGIKGELYPCKPDIFEATYELVRPQSTEGIAR